MRLLRIFGMKRCGKASGAGMIDVAAALRSEKDTMAGASKIFVIIRRNDPYAFAAGSLVTRY
jgi:hypothetical protein